MTLEARPRGASSTLLFLSAMGLVLAGCGSGDDDASSSTYRAEIRRTAMGVPHIKADDWRGLGYGFGVAQAQDNLCTIANAFLTYRGERSRYFGGAATLPWASTIGTPNNLDSDFFHRHVLHADAVAAFTAAQSDDSKQLIEGFVAGYNRYVRDIKGGSEADRHSACRNAEWVLPITAVDLYRRLYAANFAGGYANFLSQIANAQPPAGVQGSATGDRRVTDSAPAGKLESADVARGFADLPFQVGGNEGVGSNMFGFGTAVTDGAPLLFGNPHWYWRGPDRFYQAQLTIPGKLDVSGASFLGVPVIQIGFNENVAWSHTVSTARRFGFFQLTLANGNPTRYVRDGQTVAMTAVPITVQVRDANGVLANVDRTLYRTPMGPLVDVARLAGPVNPALAWSTTTAFVIRDINEANYRTFRTWMRWGQAKSLDEFRTIHAEEAAIPWVNTIAVGRGSNQAYYGDVGAMPNVPPQVLAACTTPVGQAVAAALPRVPFLDGSRSACDWVTDVDSRQPGAIGASRMPTLLRNDYVANMNDSAWLTNPAAPLTGYPAIVGPEAGPVTLRTRLGHLLVQARLAGTDGLPGNRATPETVRSMVLNSRVLSAELFKADALRVVCAAPTIALTTDALTGETFSPAQSINVQAACATLQAWDNTGRREARGTHVWDEFWLRASRISTAQLYSVPFDPADPVNTPRGLRTDNPAPLQQAFAAAVQKVQASPFPVDATRAEVLFATRNGARIGLYGGCGNVGYFTVTCSERRIQEGGYSMDGNPNGNSYMQVVSFPASGVQAWTFLTFSLSDDPASPHHGDYTRRYATGEWLRVPFTEAEIAADAALRRQVVEE